RMSLCLCGAICRGDRAPGPPWTTPPMRSTEMHGLKVRDRPSDNGSPSSASASTTPNERGEHRAQGLGRRGFECSADVLRTDLLADVRLSGLLRQERAPGPFPGRQGLAARAGDHRDHRGARGRLQARPRGGRQRLPQEAVHPPDADAIGSGPGGAPGPDQGRRVTQPDVPGAEKEDETQQSPESLTASLLEALGDVDRGERARAIAGAAEMVDPDLLIEAVADHVDSRRRNAAMDALAKGGARSVPALIRGLRHPDGEVVMFSAGVLARTGSPAAIPHLVSLLDHDDINVAQQVIDSLAQMRSAVAVEALVRVLDRDPWLRFAAVHALGEIGDQRAVPALAPLLADDGVRGAVIRAMGKIGSTDALAFLFRVVRENQDTSTFAQCLSAIGEALEFQPSEEALQNIADWTELGSASPG